MRLRPDLRRFTFAAHIASSIGWIGAVLVFLALAGVALTSPDEATVRGAYVVMLPAAWFVLVPLAHAALATGIALSLGTQWLRCTNGDDDQRKSSICRIETLSLSSDTTRNLVPLLGVVMFALLVLLIIHRFISQGTHGH